VFDFVEVCACDARFVGVVEHDAAVSKESWCAWCEGDEFVGVVRAEAWELGDFAVFTAQIADLATRRVVCVAWRIFTTGIRVKVSFCVGAIATSRDWNVVDMVHCRACKLRARIWGF
jgi:hypothetical protein